jgi:hypothetical protein
VWERKTNYRSGEGCHGKGEVLSGKQSNNYRSRRLSRKGLSAVWERKTNYRSGEGCHGKG